MSETAERTDVRLDLEGMTCASCAARIETKLNRLEGVDATVNLATEQATVHADRTVGMDALLAAVESAGYHARPAAAPEAHGHDHDERPDALRRRLVGAA
ncbi:MAG TPA: heavy metal-associated domain-containing protein, partial [Gaiellaceae bacterium]